MSDKVQRYNVHAESIAMKLGALTDWLQWETQERAFVGLDWANVGDLAHVDELLSQLCENLSLEVEI